MSHIKSVTLSRLNITSLDGLGQANQSVQISDCWFIRSWSAFSEKEFFYFKNYLMTMNIALPTWRTLVFSPLSYSNTMSLREVIVDSAGRDNLIDDHLPFWKYLEALLSGPNIDKIVLKLKTNKEIYCHERFRDLLSKYVFTAYLGHRQLVLLRREVV